MKLTREEVLHVATLARLDLADDEVAALAGDLSAILSYVDKLGELDTAAVEPTSNVVAIEAAWRDDEVTSTPDVEAALAGAPKRDAGFFVVPPIIE